MATIEKAFWSTSGDSISFRMPIQKVDVEKRIVSGWATTDVLDKQGDIVSMEASVKAFDEFRGNVREQHTSLAVGKVISFKQEKYYDKKAEKFYNGIYVDVYISKGAQDTWYKVTEQILTGFSIGGNIKDSEQVYNKEMDAPVRVIKDYDLYELSLVDNPANPASNVVSVQKFDGIDLMEKNYLENVFWCSSNDTIMLSENTDQSCPQCNKNMVNIGFVESNDSEKSLTVNKLIDNFTKFSETIESESNEAIDGIAKSIAEKNEKEVDNMGILNRKTTTVVEETIAKSDDEAVEVVAEEVVEEVIEKAAEEAVEEAAEEVAEEADVEKSVDSVETEDSVEKSTTPADSNEEDLAKAVDEIKVSVAEAVEELTAVVKSIADQVADLRKSIDGVREEFSVVKGNVSEFGQRVEDVEADTAVRKSGDLGGIVQEQRIEKSMWGGRFLNSADLYQ